MAATDPLLMMLIGGVVAAVPVLFAAYVKAQSHTVSEVEKQRDVYKAIADRAVYRLEQEVNDRRTREGLAPIEPLAAVVPEHQSPTSKSQRETALAATLRARLVAAELGSTLLVSNPPDPASPLGHEWP